MITANNHTLSGTPLSGEVLPQEIQQLLQQNRAATLSNVTKPTWWHTIRVREIMSSPVICVDTLTSIPEAQLLMQERNIRRLPVIDDGKLVGILTQGDVRGALPSEVTTLNRAEQAYLMKQVKVDRVMHTAVVTVTGDTTLAQAARLMVQYKIGGLPVLGKDGAVVGMVTESDVFTLVVKVFAMLDQA
ncbi:MAG: CBS domain-containing protein [Caldilineaceae bacterium]